MPQSPRPTFIVGDQVTIVGDCRTVYRITYIYRNGLEVNLALPRTNLERCHVPMADLNTTIATTR